MAELHRTFPKRVISIAKSKWARSSEENSNSDHRHMIFNVNSNNVKSSVKCCLPKVTDCGMYQYLLSEEYEEILKNIKTKSHRDQ